MMARSWLSRVKNLPMVFLQSSKCSENGHVIWHIHSPKRISHWYHTLGAIGGKWALNVTSPRWSAVAFPRQRTCRRSSFRWRKEMKCPSRPCVQFVTHLGSLSCSIRRLNLRQAFSRLRRNRWRYDATLDMQMCVRVRPSISTAKVS